jgi:hypothetical protein
MARIASMKLPRQNRGVLLSFPARESATPRLTNQKCPECERLEAAYEAIIGEIKGVVHGSFASVGEKLARLSQKQDERDETLAQLYAHKHNIHSQKMA